MIALDAGVLIALFSPSDPHHERAVALFRESADELLYLSHLTQAEILVHPARIGEEERVRLALDELGITVLIPPPDGGSRLAHLRARTGLKLPDCCVILAALQSDSRIATFDDRLARQAEAIGIAAIGC